MPKKAKAKKTSEPKAKKTPEPKAKKTQAKKTSEPKAKKTQAKKTQAKKTQAKKTQAKKTQAKGRASGVALSTSPCADPYGLGVVLKVLSEDELARAIALALSQQYTAAYRIASGLSVEDSPTPGVAAETIIQQRLRTTDNNGVESKGVRYHRDGLLFQLIAWVASYYDAAPSDVVRRPHLISASKGIDAGIVHLEDGVELASVSICEDKATDNPRDTIRDEVWPEFVKAEEGERDDELRTFAIDAFIQRNRLSEGEAERAAGAIIWSKRRRYRVRITVATGHKNPPRRGDLFKGFEEVARGDKSRRRGETLYLKNLRPWMDSFAGQVVAHLRAL